MYWRLIFTASLILVVALTIGVGGILLLKTYPAIGGISLGVDVLVVAGGVKAVFESIKTVTELKKLELENQKLALEIEKLTRDQAADNRRVTPADNEQMKRTAELLMNSIAHMQRMLSITSRFW